LAAFFSQGARAKSAKLLAERIAARKGNDPYMVIGDFNMHTNNSAMEYLLTTGKMTDAWDSLNPSERGPRYDHITLSSDVKAKAIEVDERKASDHEAVVANLEITSPAKLTAQEEKKESASTVK
jgi:endonuclease/exonuclease/phosphatase family metal-dependent hydrolase